jgi:Ca2+-binding EF-hand superfamily protein
VLAKLNPAGGIPDNGDGTGRHANKDKKKKSETSPVTNMTTDEQERATRFDKLDKARTGKLDREYFITHQSDAAAAAERFDRYDSDKDGLMSREEYIFKGKVKK